MRRFLYLFLILGALCVVACGKSLYEPGTVGIGYDYAELKKSPCACLELKKAPQLPDWLT